MKWFSEWQWLWMWSTAPARHIQHITSWGFIVNTDSEGKCIHFTFPVLPLPTYPLQAKWSSCSSSCYIIAKSVKKWGNEAGLIKSGFPVAATKSSTFNSIRLFYSFSKEHKMFVSRLKTKRNEMVGVIPHLLCEVLPQLHSLEFKD